MVPTTPIGRHFTPSTMPRLAEPHNRTSRSSSSPPSSSSLHTPSQSSNTNSLSNIEDESTVTHISSVVPSEASLRHEIPFLITHYLSCFSLSSVGQQGSDGRQEGERGVMMRRNDGSAVENIRSLGRELAMQFERLGVFGQAINIHPTNPPTLRTAHYTDLTRRYPTLSTHHLPNLLIPPTLSLLHPPATPPLSSFPSLTIRLIDSRATHQRRLRSLASAERSLRRATKRGDEERVVAVLERKRDEVRSKFR